MADPVWVDGTTPLNAANMTKLQTRDERGAPSGYAPLDPSSKVPPANLPDLSATYQVKSEKGAASGYLGLGADLRVTTMGYAAIQNAGQTIFDARQAGDAQARFIIGPDGKQSWGPGNAASDTTLYRSAAGVLQTDSSFRVRGDPNGNAWVGIMVGSNSAQALGVLQNADTQYRVLLRGDGGIAWGSGAAAFDTTLSRVFAAGLLTNSWLIFSQADAGGLAISTQTPSDPNSRFQMNITGTMAWGPGSATVDVNLARWAANQLRCSGDFLVGGALYTGGLASVPALATSAYGTSFPAAPIDGQEFTLVASTTAPGYAWRFRYNASSTSPYKWEFIGGTPVNARIDTSEQKIEQIGMSDLATVGPSFVVPRAGVYDVQWGSMIMSMNAPGAAYVGVQAGAANPAGTGVAGVFYGATGQWHTAEYQYSFSGVNAGEAIVLKYACGSQGGIGGYFNFMNRWLRITPVRLA